jgi:lysophospholipase L1-like esterase
MIILSSCTLSMGTSVKGEFHANKDVMILTKKGIPQDFFPMNYRVLSIGDSLTKGIGDSSKKGGYIPFLQSKLQGEKGIKDIEFKNYGVKGNQTKDLLNRLNSVEIQNEIKKSDIVILTIGGNDIMKVVKENISHLEKKDFYSAKVQYEKNLYGIIDKIRIQHPRIPIVLISLYNPFYAWFADVKELEEILAEWNSIGQKVLANYKNTYFVHIEDIFQNENVLHSDYFHPNNKGYYLIANRLFDVLTENVLNRSSSKQYSVSNKEY